MKHSVNQQQVTTTTQMRGNYLISNNSFPDPIPFILNT